MTKTNLRSSDPTHARKMSKDHSRSGTVLSMSDSRAKEFISPPPMPICRDQILAENAHDLNNALSVVGLQLELLALDLLPLAGSATGAMIWQRLGLIQPAVAHATDILQQLTEPSPYAPGRSANALRPIALNPVVQRMVPILSAMLPPGVTLHLRLNSDLDDVVIDPVQAIRIVSNLVLNSCAALSRSAKSGGGQVTIETDDAPTPGWIVLRVRDTGSGMPSSKLTSFAIPKPTRPDLARRDLPAEPHRERPPLGLASVRRMVHNAGGRIEVESESCTGTNISLMFPCASHSRPQMKKPRTAKS